MDCIFCKIVSGLIPNHRIYEDEKVVAFLDIKPVSKGHTLVIPKNHSDDIFAINEEDLAAVTLGAKKVADALVKATGAEGVNLMNSNKREAGQTVFHYHMHVIPRNRDDKLKVFPHSTYSETDFQSVKEKIREALK
ncbi:MAG: HIT family protein [Candidatus Micrarchaeota archaeon]